jgi:hypothetical protein
LGKKSDQRTYAKCKKVPRPNEPQTTIPVEAIVGSIKMILIHKPDQDRKRDYSMLSLIEVICTQGQLTLSPKKTIVSVLEL